jgi:Tfp pilus assembly protein PilZ
VALELLEELPAGAVEEGTVLDLLMPRSVGMYKWLCIVVSCRDAKMLGVQVLDGPMFIQRRLDPRVGANLPAQVRHVSSSHRGLPYQAFVADLSHGGLKLERARPVRTGDTVEVAMELNGVKVALLGRVVMAYPSPGLTEPGDTDVHIAFHEGQHRAVEEVDRFVAEQLACQWEI